MKEMNKFLLKNICSVSSGYEHDRFVGIKIESGMPEVHFPVGFYLSTDESELRKDIFLLIKTLKRFSRQEKNQPLSLFSADSNEGLPISSYQRMIKRYFDFGGYIEKENSFHVSKRGRIDWARTIKKIKPMLQDGKVLYNDFIVRDSKIKENTLLSEIFKYCVYISFERIGWLYSQSSFPKPHIKYNKELFLYTVKNKLETTYADNEKELLSDMIAIISETNTEKDLFKDYIYGTFEFEYVWENIVDYAYGIKDKQNYFPKTYWILKDEKDKKPNRCLEPDTIMNYKDMIFVLDGKYYRYGATGISGHLPGTSSVQKQITYAEYIHNQFKKDPNNIYNAFIMPANLRNGYFACDNNVIYIGSAESEWKRSNLTYEKVAGILVDTKYLMSNYAQKNVLSAELAEVIIKNIYIEEEKADVL